MRWAALVVASGFFCVGPAFADDLAGHPVQFVGTENLQLDLSGRPASVSFDFFYDPRRLVYGRPPSHFEILLATADRDVVTSIYSKEATTRWSSSTLTRLSWSGRDAQGDPVPNEAYFPVVRYTFDDGVVVDVHPRDYSGGYIAHPSTRVQTDGSIRFRLNRPSRVLARAGIEDGAMLRTILDWVPRPRGANRVDWDGFDASRVVRFITFPKFAVMVTGYELPDHAILVANSPSGAGYQKWRVQKGWGARPAESAVLNAHFDKSRPVSRMFGVPRFKTLDPEVRLRYLAPKDALTGEPPVLRGRTTVQVDVPQTSRALLEESLYEVAFFVDGEFVAEEEQGYVPFTWQFDPTRYGAGRHLLTVNVSSFVGQVGSASLLFEVEPKARRESP